MSGIERNSEIRTYLIGDPNGEIGPDSPRLIAIFTSPSMGNTMVEHDAIKAIAGIGLENDRYAARMGAFSAQRTGQEGRIPDDDRQVSFISLDGLGKANQYLVDRKIDPFSMPETRRNLLVAIPFETLNLLVGKRFRIGNVEFEGVELCDPCARPAILTKRKQDKEIFQEAFSDKGGLRARIINTGLIHVGDRLDTPRQR